MIDDSSAKVYYYHTDHLGTVRAITDQDGSVVFSADNLPFGRQLDKSGEIEETHGFTGKEFDSDIGLYYFNARWYDQESGRFVTEDPAGDPNNPNLYVYCANNPLIFTDPTGLIYQQDAMWLNDLDLEYGIPKYIMDNICFNMEKYGFDKATDFGFGLYEIQLGNHGKLANDLGWWKWEATPEVVSLGEKTGVSYDVGQLRDFDRFYELFNKFDSNLATTEYYLHNQRHIANIEGLAFAFATGMISKPQELPKNPEVEFTKFNFTKAGTVNTTTLANTCPINIPSAANVKIQTKIGYEQVRYTWSDGVYKFEARWHTRTPGAPAGQGNTWVVTRTTPGTPTGQIQVQHVLTGNNNWTPMHEWQNAIKAYQNGTATAVQNALLSNGHWQAP